MAAHLSPFSVMQLLAEAVAAQGDGSLDKARMLYRQLLHAQPNQVEALQMLGALACDEGNYAEGFELFARAVVARPSQADLRELLARALFGLERWDAALAEADHAIALATNRAGAHAIRGKVLHKLDLPHEALESYDRAIELNGDLAQAYCNRAVSLDRLGRPAEAMVDCERALAIDPASPDAYSNRGGLLCRLGLLDEAMQAYDRALALAPTHTLATYGKACVLLLQGDYQRGWPLYESRWGILKRRPLTGPLWTGQQPLVDKTILLYAEQGLGDCIMLSRFAAAVAVRGARVILQVKPALVPLLRNVAGATLVIGVSDALPEYDYHCPLFSLPAALGLRLETIPGRAGYLACSALKAVEWSKRLGPWTRLRIGIAWSGFAGHSNDRNRSIAFARFAAALPDCCDYVCLQKEIQPGDRDCVDNWPAIRRFDSQLHDFADTAALCSQMDLVVSVDTSVVHLAGALGRPTWILLPFAPDYRWLQEGEDCPWYASARLLRQGPDQDWAPVLQRVRTQLQAAAQSLCLSASVVNESAKKSSGESFA